MTIMRWLATLALVLALACRFAWRLIPLDFAFRVTPEGASWDPDGHRAFLGSSCFKRDPGIEQVFQTR
jgi:hypothetical protein